ncbi:MAG: tetratricopeptide repeat protein [Planctomycetes bacterium]|nr:tetratricopeptide repeat protein [Planctomycetota bacterium]
MYGQELRAVLVFACWLSLAGGWAGAQEPAGGREAKLAERDRLGAEAARLRDEAKPREAIEAATKALAIEREVLGNEHEDVAASLERLAVLREDLDELDEVLRCREEILQVRTRLHGEAHWRTADARRDVEDTARVGRMGPEGRAAVKKAGSLQHRVHALWKEGRPADALPLAREAVEACRKVWGAEHPQTALAFLNLGAQLDGLRRLDEAEAAYEEALRIRRKALGEEHPDYAVTLKNLAILCTAKHDLGRGGDLYERVLAIRRKALGEAHPDCAVSLADLGAFYMEDVGDLAKAEPYLEAAVAAWKAIRGEESREHAEALDRLGLLYNTLGQPDRAEPLLRKAAEAFEKAGAGGSQEASSNLNNLAMVLAARGELEQAERLYERALEITKSILGEENQHYTAILGNLAMVHEERGDYARAEPLLRKVLAITERVLGKQDQDYGLSLDRLGRLYQVLGDFRRAVPLHQEALAICEKTLGEAHPVRLQCLHNLAGCFYSLNDFERAEPLLVKVLEAEERLLGKDHPSLAATLGVLGALYGTRKDRERAEPLLSRALAIDEKALGKDHPGYAASLSNLASLHLDAGDFARARPLFERSVAVLRAALGEHHPSVAEGLKRLGLLRLASLERGEAFSLLRQALDVFRESLDLAAAVQSERQQLRMAEEVRSTLDSCPSLAPLAGRPAEEACAQVLAWKGAVFARQRRMRAARARPELAPHFAELAAVSRKLAALAFEAPEAAGGGAPERARRLDALLEEREAIERRLAGLSAELRRAEASARLSPLELKDALPAGTALVDLLEYVHTRVNPPEAVRATAGEPPEKRTYSFEKERRLLAFVLRPREPVARVDLGPLKPIEEAVEAWRQGVESTGAASGLAEAGVALRKLLLEPLEPRIAGAKLLLVSPDGSLARLPLAALPGQKAGTYLIEELAVAVVPFPQALPEALGEAEAPPSLLAVGGVDYEGEPGGPLLALGGPSPRARGGSMLRFEPLPASGPELDAVKEAFLKSHPGAEARELRRAAATEAAFEQAARGSRFLHVATHGFFAPPEIARDAGAHRSEPGLLSGMVLAGANRRAGAEGGESDGILTALELASLDLSGTELMVLSACETGLGASAGGEGLLGLQRAAQVAGARSVISSLWKVDDEDARALMARFYENLWRKKLPKLEALRQAQLALLRGGLAPVSLASRGPGAPRPAKESSPAAPRAGSWAAWVLSGDWR